MYSQGWEEAGSLMKFVLCVGMVSAGSDSCHYLDGDGTQRELLPPEPAQGSKQSSGAGDTSPAATTRARQGTKHPCKARFIPIHHRKFHPASICSPDNCSKRWPHKPPQPHTRAAPFLRARGDFLQGISMTEYTKAAEIQL